MKIISIVTKENAVEYKCLSEQRKVFRQSFPKYIPEEERILILKKLEQRHDQQKF